MSAEQRWEDKGFFGRAADKVGSAILGIPNELEADLQATRNAFIAEMTGIVERIAATVEKELNAAKDDIAAGRAELKKFLDGLDPSLKTLKEQLSAEFTGKFGALETEVQKAETGLITGLAEQFKARLDESDQLLKEVRERNRDFFDVLADGITSIREKTIGLIEKLQQVFQDGVETLMRILDDPIAFAKNFLSGIAQGVNNFATNILTHLKTGLIEWLTGTVQGAGITLPTSFDLKGIVGFILQLLGLTVENVKARARIIWGEKVVRAIELGVEGAQKAIELFNILQTQGVAGLFDYLVAKFVELKDMALEKIKTAISLELVKAAVKKIATLLIPGGAFLQAVLSIIDAVFFFINNADRITELITTVINAVQDVLAGNVSALAAKVEAVLARTIPIVLDFLATLIGIGSKITDVIQEALAAIRAPVTQAIDAILLAIKGAVVGLVDRVLGRGEGAPGGKAAEDQKVAEQPPPQPGTPMTEEQIIGAVVPKLATPTQATDPAEALAEKRAQAETLKQQFQPSAPEGKTLRIEFGDRSADQVAEDREVDMEVGFSPGREANAAVPEDLVDPDLKAAIQQAGILEFLEAMASNRTVGNIDFPKFSELWAKQTGTPPRTHNREHIKNAFLAVGEAAAGGEGVHEWIPRAEIFNVVQRVKRNIESPAGITNAADWLQAAHRWRTPTKQVFLEPTFSESSKNIGGKTVIQGHPGAVFHLEKGEIRQQAKGSGKMHDALRNALQGDALTTDQARSGILGVINQRIWKGGSVPSVSDEHKSARDPKAVLPFSVLRSTAASASASFEGTMTTNLR